MKTIEEVERECRVVGYVFNEEAKSAMIEFFSRM